MAIYCGFFNSENKDRLYTAEDMTKPYELLVSNGVFATPQGTPSNYLQVYASTSMNVTVKAGRGIFYDKWFINDADMVLTIDSAEPTLPRIDTIVVKIDKTATVRAGSIIVKKGAPNSTPVAPAIETGDSGVKEYRLADIYVKANASAIAQSDITDKRGSADCPWVTSLIQQVDTSTLYVQWQNAFDTWFANVKETLATSTLIRSYENTYTTTIQDEVSIPINISQFNQNLDILQVYINGLMLIKGVEYSLTANDNTKITLAQPVDKGTPVSFVVYKSIDGTDAETVVSQVVTLQNVVDKSKITNDTGSTKLSVTSGEALGVFVAKGEGFHTMYVSNEATVTGLPQATYRMFGHMTGANNGWIIAMRSSGSVYANYYSVGQWKGWKTLYEDSPTPLWVGSSFMNANQTVTPSKKLSECEHGWLLLWSDYDDATSTKNNYNAVSICVPKKNASGNNWNGSSFMCATPRVSSSDGSFVMTVKQVYIYDDKITGFSGNNQGDPNRDVILSAVYEW